MPEGDFHICLLACHSGIVDKRVEKFGSKWKEMENVWYLCID